MTLDHEHLALLLDVWCDDRWCYDNPFLPELQERGLVSPHPRDTKCRSGWKLTPKGERLLEVALEAINTEVKCN